MGLRFTWDPRKATANERKHGVSFPEATTAFGDPLPVTIPDPDHSVSGERFLRLGVSNRNRLVLVAHTERGDTIHIISARRASRCER